jgi:hypothetical protein
MGNSTQVAGNHYLLRATNSSGPGNGGGSDPPSSGGGSTSSAWIAGAVIGPIAGVALVVLAVWFVRRRRAAPSSQYPREMPGDTALPPYVAEKTASNPTLPPAELGGTQPLGAVPKELPSNNEIVHELPANSK